MSAGSGSDDAPSAAGANEAQCGQKYEVGVFVMDFDRTFGGLLAHAVVSAGERNDAYVDFTVFTGSTFGSTWETWVAIESSWRRRTVTVVADVDDGEGMKPYRAWQLDQLPEDVLAVLEDPSSCPPLDLFSTLVRAVTPLITVRPVDDQFMQTLPETAPPWPYPEAEDEIAGLPMWQDQKNC